MEMLHITAPSAAPSCHHGHHRAALMSIKSEHYSVRRTDRVVFAFSAFESVVELTTELSTLENDNCTERGITSGFLQRALSTILACIEERQPINDEVVEGEFCFSLNQTGNCAFDLRFLHP